MGQLAAVFSEVKKGRSSWASIWIQDSESPRSDQMERFRRFKYQNTLQVKSAIDKDKLPIHVGPW